MEFLVLGPLQVRVGTQTTEIPAPKQRALLGLLITHANQVVSADRLLEEVWGDDQPKGGLKTLRYHLSKLRDALAPGRARGEEGPIATEPGGYALRVESEQLDLARFERLAAEGAQLLADDRFEAARERLSESMELWRGEALEDFRYDSFAQGEIARLEELRLLCSENRIAAELELGRHRDLVGELRDLTTRYPLRERLWGQLMTALYRSDQQAEALRAYQTARTVLGEELGIEPNTALQRLEEQILLHELPFEAPEREAPPRDNLLVRVSSFIGRQDEANELEKLVGSHRLVTLTGFGGIGKTSLAIEVARRLTGSYPNGAWLVELATLSDPSYLVSEIAQVFDVPEHPTRPLLDVMVEELSPKSMLLVIDNCEHLIDEAARVVTALLEGCPTLSVLATSREPFHVSGEQAWPVPPLDLPDVEAEVTVAAASEIDAVRLFVERAQEAQPAFELDGTNVGEVVTICRDLDGIPLALELAAARLRVLSPSQLLGRLADRFTILTEGGRSRPERHMTLRATLDWSYKLLSAAEQTLLRRLTVFEGGFTLEAIEAVCAHDGIDPVEVLDLTGNLVDASLLTVKANAPSRYSMLETVRQYGLELLASAGEEQALRRLHADYFGGLFPHEPDFATSEYDAMLAQISIEEINFRGALGWAVEAGEVDRALRLAASVAPHWFFSARMEESLYWFPRVLDLAEPTPTMDRARILFQVGHLCSWGGRAQEALAAAEELESIAERLDDATLRSDALLNKAAYLEAVGDVKESRRLQLEHVGNLRDIGGQHPDLGLQLTIAAAQSIWLGEFDHAAQLIHETEQAGVALGQPMVIAFAVGSRGRLAHYQGDLQTARRLLLEALGELRRLDRAAVQSEPLRDLAQVALEAHEEADAEIWARQVLDLGRRNMVLIEMAEGNMLLGLIALRRGKIATACQALTEALNIAVESDDISALARILVAVAQAAWASDDASGAAGLHAGAEALREKIGFVHPIHWARELDQELADIRQTLGATAFNFAWDRGVASSSDTLVDQARGVLYAEANRA